MNGEQWERMKRYFKHLDSLRERSIVSGNDGVILDKTSNFSKDRESNTIDLIIIDEKLISIDFSDNRTFVFSESTTLKVIRDFTETLLYVKQIRSTRSAPSISSVI